MAGDPKTPDALASLWGSGHADATRTRECVAMPGMREQTVLTPPCIIAALHILWPEGIQLDPCSDPDRSVLAEHHYTGDPDDGLRLPWVDRTFWNPPYGALEQWVAKERREATKGFEVAGLIPMRTHRKWFRLSVYDRVALLRPQVFVGFEQAFPAPLVVPYHGTRTEAFERAFGPLSTEVGTFTETHRAQGELL